MRTLLSKHISSFILAGVIIAISNIPETVAVCPTGNIGVGIIVFPFNINATRAESGVIVSSDCTVIDEKSGFDDTNICGTYENGSTAVCSVGTQTPDSVQTPDGLDWGSCVSSSESCSTDSNSSDNVHVEFCCAPAAAGAA